MEYFVNMPGGRFHEPDVWAEEMEAAGWDGICASDHFWVSNHLYPHVFVAATQMACATGRIKITSSFCNNLFRSPVEFAQGALSVQQAAKGRFEAGLGAGWAEAEMRAIGMHYPPPGERMSRYIEAMHIARELLTTNQCQFQGDYYQIDISGDEKVGPVLNSPPPLVGSAGGPRGIREITPLVNRIEIKASARSTRGGAVDLGLMATVTEDEVRQNIDRVRAVSDDIPIGIFLLIAAGENEVVSQMKAAMGNGYLGNFMGHPEDVAASLEQLGAWGIERVQLTEFVPDSHDQLAPLLQSN
ncbi:MAG: LLM class flavin-dependent oxidoreductase [Pseudomonadales bacterium]|nr:LLM class flavin-dependent oxidoreductase [Pseudomonadales bacterium]MBO6564881.1 LLM class flavin-dependent oxidoreductase [Pseudomonadales bacterium]MBO6596793.1 LLM class flavin-dependent oxidoreductase [Pseudomonadales bacterium]MBO6703463.1 LLM class flavin-dependent oxidoreductase [Pseudomonadales bacterium]MBO6823218.1 LLM class flavin-dependent oxidoreductase [Pseudomonadales bacterium]